MSLYELALTVVLILSFATVFNFIMWFIGGEK